MGSLKNIVRHLLLLLASAASFVAAADERSNVRANLESGDMALRRAAVAHVVQHRDVSSDEIKAIAERNMGQVANDEVVRDAILLLGKLQAREQIPYLVSRLDLYLAEERPPDARTSLPAVGALVDIGLPSVKPVIQRVRNESDPKVLAAGAAVLRFVLGRKAAIQRIDRELKNATPAERTALNEVQQELKSNFMLQ